MYPVCIQPYLAKRSLHAFVLSWPLIGYKFNNTWQPGLVKAEAQLDNLRATDMLSGPSDLG